MRIKQQHVFLSKLAKEVTRGQIVPAAFQRPYVWQSGDVLAFCESILEGFPIGSFLTWIPGPKVDMSLAGRRRIGPIFPASAAPAEGLLLDGQNRLATVAWMLSPDDVPAPADLSPSEAATWSTGQRLVVDLAEKRIHFVKAEEAELGFRLPPRVLFGSPDNMTLIRDRWNKQWAGMSEAIKDSGLKWYDKASSAFREAQAVETVLENATLEEAKRAFLHICKVGAPMTERDFDAALAWVPANFSS